jgi:hypothetical protein
MSGMGKSTRLIKLFIEHIRQGDGGFLVDRHGDTAIAIASLFRNAECWIFVWIGPDASLVPPGNPLHFNSPEDPRSWARNHFLPPSNQSASPATAS